MKQQNTEATEVTIGLDLGDRWHRFCVLGEAGEMVEEGSVGNDRVALGEIEQPLSRSTDGGGSRLP